MRCAIVTLLSLLMLPATVAQDSSACFEEEAGYLNVRRDHATWPAPEAVMKDLRSADEDVRLRALYLVGLTQQLAYETIWSQQSPSVPVGRRIIKPDEVRLSYAALGTDATQYAVVALLRGQMTYAAIIAPAGRNRWTRIAMSACWCKYEMTGQDVLHSFVGFRPAPEFNPPEPSHYELVLRASGGGTGIYEQNEAHFRIRNNELRRVMSFVSRRRNCVPTDPQQRCDLQARWLIPAVVEGKIGAVLVEGRGEYGSGKMLNVRELENRYLLQTSCRQYVWDVLKFRYEPVGQQMPCRNPGS